MYSVVYPVYNQMLQFWCVYGYDINENKEELIEVEATSINVSDISGDDKFSKIFHNYIIERLDTMTPWWLF